MRGHQGSEEPAVFFVVVHAAELVEAPLAFECAMPIPDRCRFHHVSHHFVDRKMRLADNLVLLPVSLLAFAATVGDMLAPRTELGIHELFLALGTLAKVLSDHLDCRHCTCCIHL
jgi:hypothetical protein